MRICRNVGITHRGNTKRLDDMDRGGYSNVLYHQKHQIPLNLCVVRDPAFKEPMFSSPMFIKTLKSINATNVECRLNTGSGHQDPLRFHHIVLKTPEKARIALLWFIACLTYGLTFLCYEKTIQPVRSIAIRNANFTLLLPSLRMS